MTWIEAYAIVRTIIPTHLQVRTASASDRAVLVFTATDGILTVRGIVPLEQITRGDAYHVENVARRMADRWHAIEALNGRTVKLDRAPEHGRVIVGHADDEHLVAEAARRRRLPYMLSRYCEREQLLNIDCSSILGDFAD